MIDSRIDVLCRGWSEGQRDERRGWWRLIRGKEGREGETEGARDRGVGGGKMRQGLGMAWHGTGMVWYVWSGYEVCATAWSWPLDSFLTFGM